MTTDKDSERRMTRAVFRGNVYAGLLPAVIGMGAIGVLIVLLVAFSK